MIEDQAHIVLHSDCHCDLSQLDYYDLSLPPATYNEAILHPDKADWLAAMRKELQTMKDMGVYELVELSKGRKAIGSS